MPDRRAVHWSLLVLALLAAAPSTAHAAGGPDDDAFSLMREQTVTGVNKRPLPLSETPSSVTVMTAAEIRAMNYQTLGDALRWATGVFVDYDRDYTFVGMRGLQRPGDFNNKVLLTVDGHTLNGSVYGDAFFGPELGLDLEDVERIEVVRGPGSAVYGSYAALAVVNVVTRHPRSAPGLSAAVRAGGAGEWRGRVALGEARSGWPEWHASCSWLEARGRELLLPEASRPAVVPGPVLAHDGERALSFFGTAEWGPARLAVKFNDREKTLPPASYALPVDGEEAGTWDGHDFIELSATRRASPALELSGRTYWDGSRYHARYISVYDPDPVPVVNVDRGSGDQVGAECRAQWAAAPGQAVTLGLETQRTVRGRLRNYDLEPYVSYYDWALHNGMIGAYAQDEVRIGQHLIVTAGGRYDHDSRYDAVLSPRADLVWTVAHDTRLKLLGGSAFRAPSAWENANRIWRPLAGDTRLDPERVGTLEGTLEQGIGACTVFLTAYGSNIRDLITLVEIDSAGATTYMNRDRVHARGFESGVRFTPDVTTHARVSLAWQRCEDADTGVELTNSPRWNAHVLAFHSLPGGRTTLGAGLRYLSPRLVDGGRRTSAAAVCDASVNLRPAQHVTVGLEVRNLFDARYGDPGWGEHLQDPVLQDPRSLYLTLRFDSSEPR